MVVVAEDSEHDDGKVVVANDLMIQQNAKW
jgi:hypothetical protein